MPKVHNTRKQKAGELLHRLQTGPSFKYWTDEEKTHPEQTAGEQYRRWAQSWVVPVVMELIPELRKKQCQTPNSCKPPPR